MNVAVFIEGCEKDPKDSTIIPLQPSNINRHLYFFVIAVQPRKLLTSKIATQFSSLVHNYMVSCEAIN